MFVVCTSLKRFCELFATKCLISYLLFLSLWGLKKVSTIPLQYASVWAAASSVTVRVLLPVSLVPTAALHSFILIRDGLFQDSKLYPHFSFALYFFRFLAALALVSNGQGFLFSIFCWLKSFVSCFPLNGHNMDFLIILKIAINPGLLSLTCGPSS